MDPATLILKRTFPGDHRENVQAIEQLLSKDKAALATFRAKHCLPFTTFEDVPEPDGPDDEEKPFLQTTYNVAPENKAYRSPWTNRWYVTKDIGNGEEEVEIYEKPIPADEVDVRAIEKGANVVWDAYTQVYYGKEGVGSVFLKPRSGAKYSKQSFEGIFGIQKRTSKDEDDNNKSNSDSWDSVHLVSVEDPSKDNNECEYRVESAVLVSLRPSSGGAESTIGCALTKETVKKLKVRTGSHLVGSHLENLGTMIENVEIEFRSKMESFYVPKSLEVIQSVYRPQIGQSGTVHLAKCEEFGAALASKVGVGGGASMIGEIANKGQKGLKKKNSAPLSPKRSTTDDSSNNAGSEYTNLKKGLKKNTTPLSPMKSPKKAAMNDSNNNAGSEYSNLKKGLKKNTTPLSPMKSPKKAEPTPEFMDFRNKLKKSGAS